MKKCKGNTQWKFGGFLHICSSYYFFESSSSTVLHLQSLTQMMTLKRARSLLAEKAILSYFCGKKKQLQDMSLGYDKNIFTLIWISVIRKWPGNCCIPAAFSNVEQPFGDREMRCIWKHPPLSEESFPPPFSAEETFSSTAMDTYRAWALAHKIVFRTRVARSNISKSLEWGPNQAI